MSSSSSDGVKASAAATTEPELPPTLMQPVSDQEAAVDASATTSTGGVAPAAAPVAPTEPEWPPPDWKKQKPPRKAMLHVTNLLAHRLARVRTPESASTAEALDSEITSLFASEREYAKKFDPKHVRTDEYACHAVPDCPFPKTVFIHLETLRAIQEFRKHYGTCGLEFHRAPHPVVRGVWWITDIYVYAGNEILGEMRSKTPCAHCKKTTAWLSCYCETVEFCSRSCQDRAIVDGTHTMLDCREAHARKVIKDAVRAKERMIRFKNDLEKDEALSRQITVAHQNRLADLQEGVERSARNASEYLRARRARLQAESARARRDAGLEPDPNIAPELQIGGAGHEAALRGPTGGPLPPNIPPPAPEPDIQQDP